MRNYEKTINELNFYKIRAEKVERFDGYDIITIHGGFNGTGYFGTYIAQVHEILTKLSLTYNISIDDIWLVDWINDCPDDVWTLRIGVINKHSK